MDRLPGDKFGVNDWIESRKRSEPSSITDTNLTKQLTDAIEALHTICVANEIPVFTVLSMPQGNLVFSEMGSKPQNCNMNFMLSRATASGNPEYMQKLVMNPDFLLQTPKHV